MQIAETTLMSWTHTASGKGVSLIWLTTGEIQLRETWPAPGAPTPELFPGTPEGLMKARAIARGKAQLILMG
jgi:hypothetical protein